MFLSLRMSEIIRIPGLAPAVPEGSFQRQLSDNTDSSFLFGTQGFDRVKPGGIPGGVEAKEKPDTYRY